MDISTIWYHIADVDADAKADGPIVALVTIVGRHLLLHVHGAAHCPVNAVKHDEKQITSGIDEPTAMLGDSWINQRAAERA